MGGPRLRLGGYNGSGHLRAWTGVTALVAGDRVKPIALQRSPQRQPFWEGAERQAQGGISKGLLGETPVREGAPAPQASRLAVLEGSPSLAPGEPETESNCDAPNDVTS